MKKAIIATSGYSGSGKTTYANFISKEFNLPLLRLLDYIKIKAERCYPGIPWYKLIDEIWDEQ